MEISIKLKEKLRVSRNPIKSEGGQINMKSRGLLTLLAFSEKREELILFLLDEPRTLEEIYKHLKVTSPEIIPRIKEMEDKNLVCRENKKYALTPIGKVVARHFLPLVKTLRVIDKNEDFWKEHDVDVIPQHLLDRICEFGDGVLVENELKDLFEPHKEFLENILKSGMVMGVSPVYNPAYPTFFLQLASNNVPVSLVMTEEVFEKVKKAQGKMLQSFLDYDNTKLYISDNNVKLMFVATDYFLSLSLFHKNGGFDVQKYLMSFDESALKWGAELFECFRQNAEEIRNL